MASTTSWVVLLVSTALLVSATASAVATLPGGSLRNEPDETTDLEDSEAAEAGSRSAGGRQGQSDLDVKSESEVGAGLRSDERSEASITLTEEEGEQVDTAFNAFVIKHHRGYQHGTAEYEMRKALFKQRLANVHKHNVKPGRLWKAGASKFSDRTEDERKAVRGYRRNLSRRSGVSMLQSSNPPKHLPESKSWMHLKVAHNIRDQGSCGSCWAITTTSVLEAHYEIYSAKDGATKIFSPQQTLECTPNPQECGGQGGCEGATVELGMGWILKNGIASEDDVPYTGEDGQCTVANDGSSGSGGLDTMKGGHGDDTMQVLVAPSNNGGAAIGLMNYHTLEQNADYPLAEALVQYGPVAVSASAGSWFEYESGVFDGCEPDTIVDHAITLYGYGKDQNQGVKYWNIRNSWGSEWGERGFIRLLRHDDNKQHCGTDSDPSQGLGCKGGPSSVTVCGMCGVLYDSVVPYFSGSPGYSGKGSASTKTESELDAAADDNRFDEVADTYPPLYTAERELQDEADAVTGATRSLLRFKGDGEVAGLSMSDSVPATSDSASRSSPQADTGIDAAPSLMRMEAKPHRS